MLRINPNSNGLSKPAHEASLFRLQFSDVWLKYSTLSKRYPKDSEGNCVGESFKPCEQEDPKSLCVGRAYRAYFYEFRDKQNFSYQIPVGGGYGESYMFYSKKSLYLSCFYLTWSVTCNSPLPPCRLPESCRHCIRHRHIRECKAS